MVDKATVAKACYHFERDGEQLLVPGQPIQHVGDRRERGLPLPQLRLNQPPCRPGDSVCQQ